MTSCTVVKPDTYRLWPLRSCIYTVMRAMIAVLIGLKIFTSYLQYKAVVVFTDNEGALGSLISCKSENSFGQKLVELICELEGSSNALLWYERVNTASNIADLPSRDLSLCNGLGERVRCDLDELKQQISFTS